MKFQQILSFSVLVITLGSCANAQEVNRTFVSPNRDIEVCRHLEFREYRNGYEVLLDDDFENTAVVIPELYNNKPVLKIAERGFDDCQSLRTLYLPKTIMNIGQDAFRNCTGLRMINIPYDVAYIEEGAFDGVSFCGFVFGRSVPIDGAYIALIHDSNNVAWGCNDYVYNDDYLIGIKNNNGTTTGTIIKVFSQKSSYDIPRYINYYEHDIKIDAIGHNAFRDNEATLEKVNIPSTVTSIGDAAFLDCSSLKEIRIPSEVEFMGKDVFKGCSNLTIRCDFNEQPLTWNPDWNPDNLPVSWKN